MFAYKADMRWSYILHINKVVLCAFEKWEGTSEEKSYAAGLI